MPDIEEVMPLKMKNYIFCYKNCTFEELTHDASDTCEDVCKFLCKKLSIAPVVQLLFGLRSSGKHHWLPGCRELVNGERYEYRVRFKLPKLSELNTLNRSTYDYYYDQVRYDVLQNNIKEIEYPKYKNDILGLCVTAMYVEMIENNRSVEYFKRNYKHYIPKDLAKNHSIFAKNKIENTLKSIKNKGHDAFYVKGIYLQQIDSKAPNYLTEQYQGVIPYLKEDCLKEGTCSVRLEFSPYHTEQPGLRIYYAYKKSWQHVSQIADFYTITIDENTVSLEIQNTPLGFTITMADSAEIESFVSCICGYYRLMVKWNVDLCSSLASPSLKFLTELKIHGPIGGSYSYNKIEEKNHNIGSFIVRQCETNFDTYYIDIVTKENKPVTFKILYKGPEQWCLVLVGNEVVERIFTSLIELARSIQDNPITRIPPTQHDKSPLLLLCLPECNLVRKETTGLRSTTAPLLLRASEDLMIYMWNTKEYGDGVFMRMKAVYKQPTGKKIDVTLKVLKKEEVANRLTQFVNAVDKWAKLDLSEIVKMHGLTLQNPISMVLESIKFGPLDEFLKTPKYRKHIQSIHLVETAYSLAKALHYLQEHQIVHGRIRCSSLQVTQFEIGSHFTVKLGDPGVPMTLTNDDIPWIPIENYDNIEASQKNLKADIWAYATTLWEIFSRGEQLKIPNAMDYFMSGDRPSMPYECYSINGIYDIMVVGWNADPEKRFSPQNIFSTLLAARTSLTRIYTEPTLVNGSCHGTTSSKNSTNTTNEYSTHSILSNDTFETDINSTITRAYIEKSRCSSMSQNSNDGGSSQASLLPNGLNGSQSTIAASFSEPTGAYFCGVPEMVEFNQYKLIFQGEIGRGNYGRVYRGLMEAYEDESETTVAMKLFCVLPEPPMKTDDLRDFQREAKIMKNLRHENIVRIYGFTEQPLLIIMEYMTNGCLLSYLSFKRPDLKEVHLLNFAKNIASGMQYLESQNIVHRDLATRNVLVASNNCVKIADFGLAQYTDNTGYYHVYTRSRALPLKWYAPETLEYLKFNHQSDVWSYGVTLFEIFSFGDSPNLEGITDLTADLILTLLKEGKRLQRPDFCDERIYDSLMNVCWNFEPVKRPCFKKLLSIVEELLIRNGERV